MDPVEPPPTGKNGQKIFVPVGKNTSTPLGNCPIILSQLEMDWKELHSKTIPTEIFELETIESMSQLESHEICIPTEGKVPPGH